MRIQKKLKYSFIFFFLGYSCLLLSQIPIHWTINKTNGLPTNTIYKMLQDNDDLIWLATSAGLVRYNSLEFTNFSNNELQDNEFVTLSLDSLNRVWVTNISNQIAYVHHDKLINITLLNLPLKVANISLYFSKQHLFIIMSKTSAGSGFNSNMSYLCKIPIDEISNELDLNKYLVHSYKNTISTIIKLGEKLFILIARARGKYEFEALSQKSSTYKVPKKIKQYLQNWGKDALMYLLLADDIHLIYGKSKCIFWDDKENIIYKETKKDITSIGKLENKFWLLTTKGVLFLNKKNKKISPQAIFTNYAFSSFLQDREGNTWLGTLDKGILVIPSENFQSPSYDKAPFFSLFASPTKLDFWAGSRDNLLFFEKGNHAVEALIPPAVGRILSIHQKNDLTVFAADNGSYWSEHSKNEFYFTPKSKSSKKIFFDSKDKLWLGRYNSLISHYDVKRSFNKKTRPVFVLSEKTFAIEEDKQGNIWAGTISGLYKIAVDKETLRIGGDSTSFFVKDIKMGTDTSLFVATCNNGILQINPSSTQINILKLPYQDCFNTLLCEKDGIWIGGNKGIIYYNLIDHSTYQISRYDGLPSNEINALISRGNWIWAATAKGLVRFPKNAIKNQRKPAVILIKTISINGDKIDSNNSSLHLKHFQNNLKIEFETINFYLRGTTEFKYRLLPSTKWFTTYQPYAQFTNLQPGHYQFEVSLANNVPVAKLPILHFSIDTPWWQKLWLQLLIIVFLLGLTLWWGYVKQQKVLSKEKRERKEEREKEKADRATQELITALKMTALQAQMNPHFIFNCLNTIQSFIFKNETIRATESLGMFSKLIRNVFEYSEEKVLSLEKEIDFLHLYIKLEQLRFDEDLEVKIVLSDFVTENLFALQIPPLLIQPIIENAFAHGLMHLSGQKKLSIYFEMKGDYLKCIVTDNGVGRAYTEASNDWEIKNKKPSGLILTKQRLKTFNNQTKDNNKLKNYLVITDLKDKTNGTAIGTQIEMYIKND